MFAPEAEPKDILDEMVPTYPSEWLRTFNRLLAEHLKQHGSENWAGKRDPSPGKSKAKGDARGT
jgi:hypothetical protein